MGRPKGSKNAPRVSLKPLDFEGALEALANTGPPPEDPVGAEREADEKSREDRPKFGHP
jgi:hypothetical protein